MKEPINPTSNYMDAEKYSHVPKIEDVGFMHLPGENTPKCDVQLLRELMEVAKLRGMPGADLEFLQRCEDELTTRIANDTRHQIIRDAFLSKAANLEMLSPGSRANIQNKPITQVVEALKTAMDDAGVTDPVVCELVNCLTIQSNYLVGIETEIKRIYHLPDLDKPHRYKAFQKMVGSLIMQMDNRINVKKALEDYPVSEGWVYGKQIPSGVHGDTGIRYYEAIINGEHRYIAVSNTYIVMFGFDEEGQPKHLLMTDHIELSIVSHMREDVSRWDILCWRDALVDDIDAGYYQPAEDVLAANIKAYVDLVKEIRKSDSGLILPDNPGEGKLILPGQ